jgi:PAS domain S-box-containing protein
MPAQNLLIPKTTPAESTFRQLLDAAPDAEVIINRSGEIVMVNLQVERFFGYRRQELLDQKIEVLMPERFRNTHTGTRTAFFAEHQVRAMEAGIELFQLRKDGTEFPVDITLRPVESAAGLLASNAIRDSSGRLLAEEQLRHSNELFHLMVNSIKDYSIIMMDVRGYIVTWNAGAELIKGYRAHEIVGRHFSLFFPAAAIEAGHPEHELSQATAHGTYQEEGWRVRKDGVQFWASAVTTALLDSSGKLLGFAKVTRDMTTWKQAEARYASNIADLVVANRELEAFAYSVSHDLRAPLRHLDGFAELLRKSQYDQLDTQGQRYLDKISSSAQRMGRLIDDLLAFSRLRRAEVSRSLIDLSLIQAEVQVDLEPELVGRQVQWIVGNLPEVYGDRAMLRQVFVNLLSNAVKYTRDQPAARIQIGCSDESNGEIVLFVRDNGVGFEMEYVDKLFNVFQRLHSDEFEGTGVGLANVRRIVERHGGRVWAEGVVNQGATFYFSLPGLKKADHE